MSRAHLSDDRLIEICLGDPFAPLDDPHLLTCDRCERRRVALASTLGDVTARAIEEADERFPAERLVRQHAHIMQQVDHSGRPARVIAFPVGYTSESVRPAARRVRRWLAATGAVAAAFLVGIFTEHLVHLPLVGRPEVRVASRTGDAVASAISDDELLGQIEQAVISAGPAALRPLDALTPRAWDDVR
jgi:hypothetical protein